jgi:hypothetical protein
MTFKLKAHCCTKDIYTTIDIPDSIISPERSKAHYWININYIAGDVIGYKVWHDSGGQGIEAMRPKPAGKWMCAIKAIAFIVTGDRVIS